MAALSRVCYRPRKCRIFKIKQWGSDNFRDCGYGLMPDLRDIALDLSLVAIVQLW